MPGWVHEKYLIVNVQFVSYKYGLGRAKSRLSGKSVAFDMEFSLDTRAESKLSCQASA